MDDQNPKSCCVVKDATSSFIKCVWEKLQAYRPLAVVVLFVLILTFVQAEDERDFMPFFMGYFFIFLSMFKFFDLTGFVDGFSTYDLLAQRIRAYGYVYPFIEFFIGIFYLTRFTPDITNGMTLLIMTVSGLGVLRSILRGQKIKCACLGNVLNVPLSTVSLVENFGMGLMAAYALYRGNL